MQQSPSNPVTPPVMALVVAGILLTVFAWAWAVRRPSTPGVGSAGGEQPTQGREPFVYAAIGASDVVGVGARVPAQESWVNGVHARLPAGSRLVRLGRSGITLAEAARLEVPQAIAARPDLVTIWNCVNDATRGVPLESYLAQLKGVLARLTRETEANVLLLNMPDITVLTPSAPEEQRALIRGGIVQWNRGMSETAASFGERVVLIDLFPVSDEVLAHPDYISADNFHPSTTGYARLAELAWEAITARNFVDSVGNR